VTAASQCRVDWAICTVVALAHTLYEIVKEVGEQRKVEILIVKHKTRAATI
jgi:hypothetical protein